MLPFVETVDGGGVLEAFEETAVLLVDGVELTEASVAIQGEAAGVALLGHGEGVQLAGFLVEVDHALEKVLILVLDLTIAHCVSHSYKPAPAQSSACSRTRSQAAAEACCSHSL